MFQVVLQATYGQANNLINHQTFGTRRVYNQCLYCGSQAVEHSERYYPQFRHSPRITSCIARKKSELYGVHMYHLSRTNWGITGCLKRLTVL